jgi:hypothetical protein
MAYIFFNPVEVCTHFHCYNYVNIYVTIYHTDKLLSRHLLHIFLPVCHSRKQKTIMHTYIFYYNILLYF